MEIRLMEAYQPRPGLCKGAERQVRLQKSPVGGRRCIGVFAASFQEHSDDTAMHFRQTSKNRHIRPWAAKVTLALGVCLKDELLSSSLRDTTLGQFQCVGTSEPS